MNLSRTAFLRWVFCVATAATGAAVVFATTPPAASAAAVKPIGVGTRAPHATLRTIKDAPVSLASVLARKPTVLVFYRGSWCPYCNRHLAALAELEPQLLALGYQIVAVSPDPAAGLRKSIDKNKLNYQLLSDREMQAAGAFGVAFRMPAETAGNYLSRSITLAPVAAGDGHWVPVPSVFIVDRAGTVRFAHSDPDYKVRLGGAELLAAAKAALQ